MIRKRYHKFYVCISKTLYSFGIRSLCISHFVIQRVFELNVLNQWILKNDQSIKKLIRISIVYDYWLISIIDHHFSMLSLNTEIVNFIKICHINEYNFFLITDMKRVRGNLWEYGRQAPLYVIHIYDAHLILRRFIYVFT